MQNKICKGYFLKSKCTNDVREGFTTCESHKHQEDYTDDQLQNMKECSRCHKKFYGDKKRCNDCGADSKISNAIVKEKKGPIKICKGILIKNVKCKMVVRKGFSTCRQHKFQEKYTDEQMLNLSDCSGCKRALVKNPGLCEECIERGEENRDKAREKKQKEPDCLKCLEIFNNYYDNDDKQHRINKQINGTNYCGDHQIEVWVNEVKARGKVPCIQYIRGCRSELNGNYKYVICLSCRYDPKVRLRDIKKEAIKIGREIELTDDEILKMICLPCNYCKKKVSIDYEHGIDRINNEKGYTKTNSTSCCLQCNIIKSNRTLEEFFRYCKNIKNNYPSKIIIENTTSTIYHDYTYSAKKRNIRFEISKNEFNDIVKYCCYYCKNTNDNNKNGMDRLDSDKSYTKDNIVSCCGTCNKMKNDYKLYEFIATINSIVEHNKLDNIKFDP